MSGINQGSVPLESAVCYASLASVKIAVFPDGKLFMYTDGPAASSGCITVPASRDTAGKSFLGWGQGGWAWRSALPDDAQGKCVPLHTNFRTYSTTDSTTDMTCHDNCFHVFRRLSHVRVHLAGVELGYPQGDDTLVRLLLGRGSAEIYTIREVFDMFESKKVGVTHQYFPKATFSPEGFPVH